LKACEALPASDGHLMPGDVSQSQVQDIANGTGRV
jgi:hypothetical protein